MIRIKLFSNQLGIFLRWKEDRMAVSGGPWHPMLGILMSWHEAIILANQRKRQGCMHWVWKSFRKAVQLNVITPKSNSGQAEEVYFLSQKALYVFQCRGIQWTYGKIGYRNGSYSQKGTGPWFMIYTILLLMSLSNKNTQIMFETY